MADLSKTEKDPVKEITGPLKEKLTGELNKALPDAGSEKISKAVENITNTLSESLKEGQKNGNFEEKLKDLPNLLKTELQDPKHGLGLNKEQSQEISDNIGKDLLDKKQSAPEHKGSEPNRMLRPNGGVPDEDDPLLQWLLEMLEKMKAAYFASFENANDDLPKNLRFEDDEELEQKNENKVEPPIEEPPLLSQQSDTTNTASMALPNIPSAEAMQPASEPGAVNATELTTEEPPANVEPKTPSPFETRLQPKP